MKKTLGISVLLTLVALSARIPLLTGSFWLDEAAQALEVVRPWSMQLVIADDFQPPLLHLLGFFAARLSTSEWWLRTIGAVVPGVLSVVFTYLLGKKLIGEVPARWASLLLATSSLHVYFSQEFRPYMWPVFWGLASWWLITAIIDHKDSWWRWGLLWLVSVAGLYTSFLYPFLLIAQSVYVALRVRSRPDGWRWLILAATIVVGFSPWLPSFQEQLAAGGALRNQLPGWSTVVSTPQMKALPLVVGKFLFGIIDLEITWSNGVVALAWLVLVCLCGWSLIDRWGLMTKPHRQQTKQRLGLVMTWLVLPIVVSWLISFWIPVLQPKRVLFTLPAWYLFLAWLAHQTYSRTLGIGLLFYILVLNLFGLHQYYTVQRYQREQWRELHQHITRHYPDRAVAVFSFPDAFAPWRWYDDGSYPVITTGALTTTAVLDLNEQLKEVTEYDYLLVFDYLRDLTDPQDQVVQTVERFGYRPIDYIDYPHIGFVRVYARTQATLGQHEVIE